MSKALVNVIVGHAGRIGAIGTGRGVARNIPLYVLLYGSSGRIVGDGLFEEWSVDHRA